MSKIYGTPIMAGGAGGVSDTLPPMVTNLAAVAGNQQITVTYKNPVSDALAGVLVVYKTGSYPTKPTDGNKVDAGLSEKAILEGLENGADYYIRVFPYNAKKQYQTLIDGATTTARPSEGPKQVTDLKVTGSGATPVLTWKNPTDDPTYHETVVVQKVDSAPTSLSDGTEIYRGTGETVSANGLEQLVNYYFGVFTINAEGGTRGPVISDVYSYDFPEEPTGYSTCAEITATQEYVIPENGYFRIDAVAKSGDGGNSVQRSGDRVGVSGGGGTGGHSRSEIVAYAGNIISIDITNGIVTLSSNNIESLDMIANPGSNGGIPSNFQDAGTGGRGGSAIGGNKLNENGVGGQNGRTTVVSQGQQVPGGIGGSKTIEINETTSFVTTGGQGKGVYRLPNGNYTDLPSTAGAPAKVFISRGNTNIPSPSTASTLSLLPTDGTLTVGWTNSGDPVQTGTTLVCNTNHVPTFVNDGVSVDIPVTQAVAATFAVDGDEQQADTKKQSYAITGLTNNKPVYVALFPYDANKKYGIPKTDVEIPRVHSWYDTQQELKQEVQEAEQEAQEATERAEQAQETVTMTRDFLPDAIAFTTPQIYDEWNPSGIAYTGKNKATESSLANIVRYQDRLYRCLQSHTSQADWNPTAAVSLWVEIANPAEEWPEWKQPTGAHDAYSLGAKVSHNGKKWISQIDANTTEPGTDERYWKEYTE